MRVAMYYNNHDVRLEEMPVPQIGPGELLLKVEAGGLCGSDVMEWYRIQRAPLVLGHEVSGQVVQTGVGVERYKEGDRLVVTHHVPCNACRFCLSGHHTVCDMLRETNFDPGGFSEYLRVPAMPTWRWSRSAVPWVTSSPSALCGSLLPTHSPIRTFRLLFRPWVNGVWLKTIPPAIHCDSISSAASSGRSRIS
ncbi:MAG TPA: hypothetical protein EYO82_00335 [Gammaproteobacteria bacterium]|nr:hypothetical protein [Gammaproteobacteria bacterium]